jgi:carbon monoxide dehydrogenase subunit G
MKLEGDHLFDGPRNEVWEMVRDPDVLATCLPGTQSLTKVSENCYEGTINLRIGPVSGTFSGRLEVSSEVPPQSCTLTVEGKGAPGYAKGFGNVELTEQPEQKTLLKYSGEMQIGGKLAGVGQRLIDSVSKSMVGQGFEAMDKALAARMAVKAGQASEYKAPTETQFASAVAKDVSRNILSIAEVRMVLYIVPVALAFLLFAYILSKLTGH